MIRRLVELVVALFTRRPLAAVRLEIHVGRITTTSHPTKELDMELLILTDEQKATLSLKPKTAAGNPGRIDGVPAWSVSNADVLDLVPAADGLSAVVTAKGPLGPSQVAVVADADLGGGVREISAVQDVEVTAAEATVLGIEAGAPETK